MTNVTVTPMDQVTICNMAISLTGQGKYIGSILEPSAEAQACNLHYVPSLQELLGEYSWRWATKKVPLALVRDLTQPGATSDESTPPAPLPVASLSKWMYQYAFPADCVKFRRLPNLMKHDSLDSLIEFEVGAGVDLSGNPATLIYTDMINAWGEYVYLCLDPTIYPSLFVKALYYLLGSKICPQLTQKVERSNNLLQLYAIFRDKAIQSDLVQGDRLLPRVSGAEQARGGFGRISPFGSGQPGGAGPPYIVEG